jgi:hypothetical protein
MAEGSLDKNRGKRILGAGLIAGALAAGGPAHGQEANDGGYADTRGEYTTADTDTEYSADLSDYTYQPSKEVVDLFAGLDDEFGDSLTLTQDQASKMTAKIHAAIDDFVAKHP